MWKHTQTNAYHTISLHDCIADEIRMDGEDLVFSFSNGFWVTPTNEYSDREVTVSTGPSEVCFRDADVWPITLLKSNALFKRRVLCHGQHMDIEQFLRMHRRTGYAVEFITEYHNTVGHLYQGIFRNSNTRKPYIFQMELDCSSVEYRWNELTDNKW